MDTVKGIDDGWYYFDANGTYGEGSPVILVNTDEWTDEDWERIERASDSDRQTVAWNINLYYDGFK